MTSAAPAIAAPAIVMMAVSAICPNPNNPRRITDAHPSLPDLAASLLSPTGMIEPVVVLPTGMLLAGERRWRAARIAKIESIPAIVRDVPEGVAFAITVVENLQREGLHWLEEARGVAAMRSRGWDVDGIAKEIGKSEAWVAVRMKLVKMSPKWLACFDDPKSGFHLWPIAMIEQIARLPVSAQEELLGNNDYEWDRVESADELKKYIDKHYLLRLQSAPWALDDAKLLPKAGACSACQKRSSCQNNLFEQTGGDRCTDRPCWEAKSEAHVKQRIIQARQDHPTVKISLNGGFTGQEMKDLGLEQKDLHNGWGWKDCKKDDKGAEPVLEIAADKAIRLVWRKRDAGAKDPQTGRVRDKGPSAAEREKKAAEGLERKRINHVIEAFDSQLQKQGETLVRDPVKFLALVSAFGVDSKVNRHHGAKESMKAYRAHSKKTQKELVDVAWRGLRANIGWSIAPEHLETGPADVVTELCEIFGEKWQTDLQGWMAEARKKFPPPHHQMKKYNPDKILAAQGLPRKAYTKETASGSFRQHLLNYPALLKKKIMAEGLSLALAAKKIGVSVPALRTAITGKTAPNARTAGKYCKFLGIPLAAAAG